MRKVQIKSFDQSLVRTGRYAKAMTRYGSSRLLELLPVTTFIAMEGGIMLDMMSGNGFVAKYLGTPFDTVHAVDIIDNPLNVDVPISAYFTMDVSNLNSEKIKLSRYDIIISLAGFHHVLPVSFTSCNHDMISQFRINCLRKWRYLLKKGGRIILADVPSSRQVESPQNIQKLASVGLFPNIEKKMSEIPFIHLRNEPIIDIEPSDFFEKFVSKESITPHNAVFETQSDLHKLLEQAGYINVKSSTFFTPWYFRSFKIAAWFIYHLLGIGNFDFDSPNQMPQALVDKIKDAVKTYLDIWTATDGGIWVGWKLLYAFGETD